MRRSLDGGSVIELSLTGKQHRLPKFIALNEIISYCLSHKQTAENVLFSQRGINY